MARRGETGGFENPQAGNRGHPVEWKQDMPPVF